MAIDPSVGASVAVLIVQLFQWLREGRQHKWQQDQAKADSAERIAVAEALSKKVEERTNIALNATKDGVKVLADKIDQASDKIDQNTEISTKAFNEANGVNSKLVAIGEARLAGKVTDRSKIDKIAEVVDGTNKIVSDTNKVVHKIGES